MIIQNESFETNDQRFIRSAIEAGLAEVVLGKLAVEQATSDKVKEFARMMVSDHTSASDELRVMAKGKNVALPDVCITCKDKIRDLQRFRGREFDRRYVQLMVSEVQEAIATFSDESRAGGDADLRAWATKRLTSLQQNLSAAEGL
jgi:putative membrane protein